MAIEPFDPGRVAEPDPRDANHPMRALLAPAPVRPRRRPWGFRFSPLDQGRTGTCVGHAGKALLLAYPVPVGRPVDPPSAFDLYDESCLLDEWPENDVDPERQWGSSGNGLMKALRARGLVTRWVNADPDDPAPEMDAWLALHGPVCVGMDWPMNWFDTDDRGVLPAPSASIAGGHEFLVRWHDAANGVYLIQQSWGRAVGKLVGPRGRRDGLMRARVEHLIGLVRRGGDVKAPTEGAFP